MKKLLRRTSAIMLCFAVLAVSLFIPDMKAEAAETTTNTVTYFAPKGNTASKQYKLYVTSKISNPKSSNKNVATASIKKEKDVWVLTVRLKKTGTTTISYTGPGYTHKIKFTVKKYTTPVQSLKIGKATLTSKYKNSYQITGSALSGKISVKTKNGWKLNKAWKFKTSLLTSKKAVTQIPLNLKKNIKVKKGERLILQFTKGSQTMSLRYDVK